MSLLTNITIDNTDTENVLTPFREILPTDTFNDWRRKTNGLKLLLDEFAEGVNDSTITITTSNGLTGASNFTLNQATDENINLAVDTNVIATKSFVSDSVGTGVVTLQAGVGVSIVGDRNIDLNANSNKTITINSDATADITEIVGYTGELFQTAYFTGDGDKTEFSLQDQPGFQDPTSPSEHKPITTRPGGFIVTIDGIYQIPGNNGESNQAPNEGAYWIRDNGDDTYDLVFVEEPPAASKICISSVISYNDKLGVNNSTITLSGTGAITGGGSFNLNQEAEETLPSFKLNIDTGLLTQSEGNLTLSDLTAKRVLGNLGASSAKPSPVTVDEVDEGLTSNDTRLATSAAIKNYVDNTFRPGEIVQQFYYRVDAIKSFEAKVIYTTGDRKTTEPSATDSKLISMQGLNFSSEGNNRRDMYAGEVSDLRVSIKPRYANSLIVIEMVLSCEPNQHNSGFWIGELNASDEIQIITREGYEGYNPNVQTGRNNFYSSGFYDADTGSTMKSIPLTYIDKPNTTNEKTYSPIFGSERHDANLILNRTKSSSNNYAYEYGVSTISIKELKQ